MIYEFPIANSSSVEMIPARLINSFAHDHDVFFFFKFSVVTQILKKTIAISNANNHTML